MRVIIPLFAFIVCACRALLNQKHRFRDTSLRVSLSMRDSQEKVVVTGLGVVSPTGTTAEVFFDNLSARPPILHRKS